MGIAVTSGPARVIGSGMVTCFMGQDLALSLTSPVDLVVEFSFSVDESVEDVAVHTESEDNRIRIHCVNFDQPDGRGSAQPVLIGVVGSVVVFLHFRVFRFGRTEDRTLHYTLYSALKDDIGWKPID